MGTGRVIARRVLIQLDQYLLEIQDYKQWKMGQTKTSLGRSCEKIRWVAEGAFVLALSKRNYRGGGRSRNSILISTESPPLPSLLLDLSTPLIVNTWWHIHTFPNIFYLLETLCVLFRYTRIVLCSGYT